MAHQQDQNLFLKFQLDNPQLLFDSLVQILPIKFPFYPGALNAEKSLWQVSDSSFRDQSYTSSVTCMMKW